MRAMSRRRRQSTARMRATRHIVAERSGGFCAYCDGALAIADDGEPIFDDHHIVQRSVGGSDDPDNRVALHHHCHMTVHDMPAKARTLGLIKDSWEAPDDAA